MTTEKIAHPPIVSAADWLNARKGLLTREKEATRARDALNAARRRLPMTRMEKDYRFMGLRGEVEFPALFAGRHQLIVYHFMFDPRWDDGCQTCSPYVDSLGDLTALHRRDVTFALVSCAPYARLAEYQARRGWDVP